MATVGAMNVPDDLLYSADHEWIQIGGNRARVGITDYAQDALGDVVYAQIPAVGSVVVVGESFGEVESTKSVSDIYAPVSGTVVATNAVVTDKPESINEDAYGNWLFRLQPAAAGEVDALMDAAAYAKTVGA